MTAAYRKGQEKLLYERILIITGSEGKPGDKEEFV